MILTSINLNNQSICGRLGNQIFIISSIVGISNELGLNYSFNWNYSNIFNNQHKLNKNVKIITPIKQIKERTHDFDKTLLDSIKLFTERSSLSTISVNGFLQDYRYFINSKNILTDIFNIPKNKYKNTASLHVRRGDYLKYPKHHPQQSDEYYENAIDIMKSKGITNFRVYSDDIDWCKNKFKDSMFYFSENKNQFEDLYDMMLCDNNIIANSTYSWVAAFYNRNEDKTVIKPCNWFGVASPHDNDKKKGYSVPNWIEL